MTPSTTSTAPSVDQRCIDTLRTLSIDAVQKANSGHPGLPLGAAPTAFVLWHKHLKHDPSQPAWPDRDRFVLSAGHGSMLLYSLLHLYGYPLTLEDLKQFRQWGSRTPGHPERDVTMGIEATTGPLGQGGANAVGMAIAERWLAARFNKPGHEIVDHRTFALVSDGDVMEGVNFEAATLAGHLKLGKLVWLYDSNDVSLDGPTSMAFTDDVAKRMESAGWRVLRVEKGDTDLAAIDRALSTATRDAGKPTFVIVRTTLGYGAPKKAGTSQAHGSPLGEEELAATKRRFGFDPAQSFVVPEEARAEFRRCAAQGRARREEWEQRFAAWEKAHPARAKEWRTMMAGELPEGFEQELPHFGPDQAMATRQSAGKAMNHFAARVPWLIGGDADLSTSTNTTIEKGGDFGPESWEGRNVHFGVREHAMGAIANGIACHGGPRPFTATFFCFSDYMKPALRLAALSHLPVAFVFTHDSIGLGEDGPTHEPVEHLAALRALPNMHVVRPGDANEAVAAWRHALERRHGPTALVLSRQKTPTVDRSKSGTAPASSLARGGYVLADAAGGAAKAIVIATGTEVDVAMKAKAELDKKGVPTRVVSMPCVELFREQDAAWRESVLPKSVTARVSIEAASTFGWREWVGERGATIGVDRFGASAPAEKIYEGYGLTPAAVVAAVTKLVGG
jgi:transketolase